MDGGAHWGKDNGKGVRQWEPKGGMGPTKFRKSTTTIGTEIGGEMENL